MGKLDQTLDLAFVIPLARSTKSPVCSRITAKIRHGRPDLRSFAPAGGEAILEEIVAWQGREGTGPLPGAIT
jgi:hypothetical protein